MKDKKRSSNEISRTPGLCGHIEKLSLLSNTSNKRPAGSLIMYELCKQPLASQKIHL